MSDSVLVTYASRYGSTKEVAEEVATELRMGGLDVDVRPARQVKTLDAYRAVVMGAPLYIGSWLKDARRFLVRNQQSLVDHPVAIFTLGPTNASEEDSTAVRVQLDKQLSKYPWLTPVATELFGGKLDPAKWRFPTKLLAALPASPLYQAPASDIRDWDAIRAWARSLVTLL